MKKGNWDSGGIYTSSRRKPFSRNFCDINNTTTILLLRTSSQVRFLFRWCGWAMRSTMFTYITAQILRTFQFSFSFLRHAPLLHSFNLILLFFLYTLYEGVLRLLFCWKAFQKIVTGYWFSPVNYLCKKLHLRLIDRVLNMPLRLSTAIRLSTLLREKRKSFVKTMSLPKRKQKSPGEPAFLLKQAQSHNRPLALTLDPFTRFWT